MIPTNAPKELREIQFYYQGREDACPCKRSIKPGDVLPGDGTYIKVKSSKKLLDGKWGVRGEGSFKMDRVVWTMGIAMVFDGQAVRSQLGV